MYFLMTALMVVGAVSCNKDDESGKKAPEGAVDLGIVIPRGDGTSYKLYWAKANLCETGFCASESDYGDYYAWGEMEAKTTFSEGNYTYDGNPASLIEAGRDVARERLGGAWRIPTETELKALAETKDNVGYKWTFKTISGHNGYEIRYLAGNTSIFIPFGANSTTLSTLRDLAGFYWGSTLHSEDPEWACGLQIWEGEDELGNPTTEAIAAANLSRWIGCTLRPVCE